MGGLSRKSFQIKRLISNAPDQTLILDAGGLLSKTESIPPRERQQVEINAEAIIHSKSLMGYQAVGISPLDLSMGTDFLLRLREQYDFPWVSMNLVKKLDSKPFFSPYIIRNVNGVSVGILGLTGPGNRFNSEGDLSGKLLPWSDVLPDIIHEVKDQAKLIILLSSYPYATNKLIAEQFPDIQLIIQSGLAKGNMNPLVANNALLFQTDSQGKYLGVMKLDFQPVPGWVIDRNVSTPQPPSISEQQETAEEKPTPSNHKPTHSLYNNRFIAMKTSLKEDLQIRAIVDSAKKKVNDLNRRTFKAIKGAGKY